MDGKTCCKCGEWKPFSEFYKCKSKKGGYDSKCKNCDKAYKQENKEKVAERTKKWSQANKEKLAEYKKTYHQANKDKKAEYDKQYYQANKERKYKQHRKWCRVNKERVSEYYKLYHKDNKDIIYERVKKWNQENKEKRVEYKKQYNQINKNKIIEHKRAYYQTEHGREISYNARLKRKSYKHKVIFKPHERKYILDRDNWTCCSCGIKVHDRSIGNWNTPDKAHIDHIIPISKGGNSEPKNLRVLCRACNLSKNNKLDEQLTLL